MKRILVAEDEDVIRDFVVINLRRSGYEVVDVPNGDEALRVFDENGGDFDICLLDIMMPGKDGFTVCKEIRKRSATVGIIMLSAKSQEMDKVGGPDVRRGRLHHQALWPGGAGGACGRAAPQGHHVFRKADGKPGRGPLRPLCAQRAQPDADQKRQKHRPDPGGISDHGVLL